MKITREKKQQNSNNIVLDLDELTKEMYAD